MTPWKYLKSLSVLVWISQLGMIMTIIYFPYDVNYVIHYLFLVCFYSQDYKIEKLRFEIKENKGNKLKCKKCGKGVIEISNRGAYLKRTNSKGQVAEWICYPFCDGKYGSKKSALLNAIKNK